MPTQDFEGRYQPDPEVRTDFSLASAVRTTTTNGTAFSVGAIDVLHATLTVSAASGTTPTVDVILQGTDDGTNYYTVGSFTQKTTTGTEAKAFGPCPATCRWKWTVGGTTPSFTFKVDTTAIPEG